MKRYATFIAWVVGGSILSESFLASLSHFALSFAFSTVSGNRSRRSRSIPVSEIHPRDKLVRTHSVALLSSHEHEHEHEHESSCVIRELETVDDLRDGSLVLSRVESSLGCHDLRQPYFHKAVILILDHDPEDFTQGVLLNRASDLTLDDRDIVYMEVEDGDDEYDDEHDDEYDDDEINISEGELVTPSVFDRDDSVPPPMPSSWRIHFGGDIGGWYEEVPQLLCLHGISSEAALAVSDPIFGLNDGVFITSHLGARSLVESGEAVSDDFYTFSGFCGWEKGQLQREVDRGSWCLASFTASANVTNAGEDELLRENTNRHKLMDLIHKYSWKNADYKPQSGGLEFWHELMNNIGKDDVKPLPNHKTMDEGESNNQPQPFSDLMVKEWSTQRLLVTKDKSSNGNADDATFDGGNENSEREFTSQIDDADIFRALKAAANPTPFMLGAILRGSSSPSSPYLTSAQLFHKSTILLLQDTPDASVGVLLNLPTKDSYILHIDDRDYQFPVRYGGPSGKGSEDDPYFWFHDNDVLKEEGIGLPVSFSNAHPERSDPHGIHVCDLEDVKEAILRQLATEDEFLLVQGFCVWEKEAESTGGVTGQILNGNLEDTELQTAVQRKKFWRSLLGQKQLLSEDCVRKNFELSQLAWHSGGGSIKEDEQDIRRVFESDVTVSKLADDALFVWMKIFLLGNADYYPENL
eukprot:jgi/Psemu1/215953/e_gw1.770.2.1